MCLSCIHSMTDQMNDFLADHRAGLMASGFRGMPEPEVREARDSTEATAQERIAIKVVTAAAEAHAARWLLQEARQEAQQTSTSTSSAGQASGASAALTHAHLSL
jgi:hypothetical protein